MDQLGGGRLSSFSNLQELIIAAVTNIFRINPALLFLLLLSIPTFISKAVKTDGLFLRAVLCIFVMRLLEAQFQTDYPVRKLIVLLPLSLIIISSWIRWLTESPRGTPLRFFRQVVMIAAASSISLYCVHNNPIPTDDIFLVDPGIYYAGLLSLFVATLAYTLFLAVGRRWQYFYGMPLISVALAAFLSPNVYAIANHRIFGASYEHRDGMKSLSPQLDGKIVAAGWSFGMRLYNRSIPVLNGYTFNYYNRPENYRAAIDAVFDSKAACCMLLGEKTFETVFPGDKRFTKIGSIAFGDVTGQESMGIFFPRSAGIQEPVRE